MRTRTQTRMKPYGHDQQHQYKLLRLSCPTTPLSSRMYTTSSPLEQPLPKSPTSDGNQFEEAPEKVWSFDNFADAIIKEAKAGTPGPGAGKTTEPSELAPLLRAPRVSAFQNVRLLLMDLFRRTLKYSLLPEVTAEPTTVGPNHGTPCWKVTIALDELGISATGHGSAMLLAEVAASIQFDLMLRSPETHAKLETFPRTEITSENATDIIQAYCKMMSLPAEELRRVVKKTEEGAYESTMFSGERQLGKPVVSAVKDLAKGINPLTVAHGIATGHSDFWPAGLENPFQAKIVVGEDRLKQLQALTRAAEKYYFTTTPGPGSNGSSQGSHYKIDRKDEDHGEDQSASKDATRSEYEDLDSFFSGLPFPPSTLRMMILGASIRCLEPAIILAALGKHDIYRHLAHDEKYQDNHLNPYVMNTVHGDHSDLILLFQRLRKISQKDSESKDNVEVARRLAKFDPSSIRSVSAAAKDIERILISAGLVGYPEKESYIQLPGSEVQVRAQPYGGQLNMNSPKMEIVRHLLALGFGRNIAQYGYGTLVPGALPELRVGTQNVHIGSPLRSPMNVKQLKKALENGPFVVLSGTSENPDGRGLTAQYSSPISTWQAVLFGEELALRGKTEIPRQPGAAQLVLNGWLPVLVKSEVPGLPDAHVRHMILEARKVLQRAMRKAMLDYIKHSWTSVEFYQLLKELPIGASMEGKNQNTVKGEENDTVKG
ncbi:hypothetical protein VMCG_10228 [Cytospora schulzeri]|uniref:Uncharacterized protein n=1 Tax=Cytospora schulzeri TaxID=448051 RepID=A0A423VEP7_9PEZI|nr:hypothetical protein VMCG_10228 [Valsa malicola]